MYETVEISFLRKEVLLKRTEKINFYRNIKKRLTTGKLNKKEANRKGGRRCSNVFVRLFLLAQQVKVRCFSPVRILNLKILHNTNVFCLY